MKNPEDIKAWAERQKDDQSSTADDKRREKLKSLMRDFSRILPQGLTVEEAARHPLNIVMFDIFDELNLGTDFYNSKMELVKTVPYKNNYGYFFSSDENSWHGMEKKEIKKDRRCIQVNYVTFKTDWPVA